MFSSWLGLRSRVSTKKVREGFRPWVESLEARDCPALHIAMTAQVFAGHQVQLSGSITGGDASGLMVMFTGAVSGSTSADASGNFSYTTTQASLGTVSASGLNTDTATATVAVTPPSFSSLAITYGSQRSVTVTGTLNSLDASGRTVSFGGVAMGSATTNSSGYFTFTGTASALGTINVSETDLWGQQSSAASVTVASSAPQIVNFAAGNPIGNYWTFSGSVTDESAPGMTINFGGLAGLVGRTTTVQADGTFSFTILLPEGVEGTATAITTDWWGLDSQMAYYLVG